MKTIITFVILIIFVISSNITNAQTGWYSLNSNTTKNLYEVYFLDANTGFISGDSGLFMKTYNGGSSWTSSTIPGLPRLFCTYFLNANTGFVMSKNIHKTTDGGNSWQTVFTAGSSDTVTSMYFTSDLVGYATIEYGVIIKTVNGGNSWSNLNESGYYYSIYFPSPNIGYVCGQLSLYKTTNAGINWSSQSGSYYFRSIIFSDDNTGFVVGLNGIYRKTTNGGTNWTTSTILGITDDLYQINKSTSNYLFIVGQAGTILKSTNSGVNWNPQYSTTNKNLYSVSFINDNIGYAIGDNGTILKTTTGGTIGIKQISENVPSKYSLSQNYPNPFNPTTKIKFDVVRLSDVKIVVYDIMGREVQTLVNESLKPGTYETSFDGSQLTSEIYFCKLITDGFTETKKMVLMK
jgi:photosystem II stability/assembly factor-like uncharacterized protein